MRREESPGPQRAVEPRGEDLLGLDDPLVVVGDIAGEEVDLPEARQGQRDTGAAAGAAGAVAAARRQAWAASMTMATRAAR
jgi:hypothetical protein